MKYSSRLISALKDINNDIPLSLTIKGQCMEPVICSGSGVTISFKRFFIPGDIIIFRRGDGSLVAHRLLLLYKKNGIWKALARADRSPRSDAAVPFADLLGKIDVVDRVPVTVRFKSLMSGIFVLLQRAYKIKIAGN